MNRKDAIHGLLKIMAFEVFEFIRESEPSFEDRWVPAVDIKNSLDLNFVAVPKDTNNTNNGVRTMGSDSIAITLMR